MQQRRRAAGRPHVRLFWPRRCGFPIRFWAGETRGQDRVRRSQAAGTSLAAVEPHEILQLRLVVWHHLFIADHPGSVAKLEGKLLDADGKVRKTSAGSKKSQEGFLLWTGSWELFDLPPGVYTLELVATDKAGAVITSRTEKVLHGNPMK